MKGLDRSWQGRAAAIAVVGLVVGSLVALRYGTSSPAADSVAASGPPRVEIVYPRRADVAQRLQSNATLEAFEEADLFAKASGYLSQVRADIGDHVKAGQVLAVIDIPEWEKDLAEAKAQLEAKHKSLETTKREVEHQKANVALQEVTLKRQEMLFKERAVTDQALDEVRGKTEIARADLGVAEANRALAAAQVDVAVATVEKIKTLLSYTEIVAPFDGVVSRRLVNRGDLVQAATANRTTPLFTLQRIDTIRVFCDIPENDVPHLRVGDAAVVKPFGFDGKTFAGTVARFAFRLNPETRNMRTEIDLPNPQEQLYPGMYAEVALEMGRRAGVLTVPVSAIGSDGVGDFVYTIKEGRIQPLRVKLGLRDGGRVEVTEGLTEEVPVVAVLKGAPPSGTSVEQAIPRGNS